MGKYNVENIPCPTISHFWKTVDSIAQIDSTPLWIDTVADGLVTFGLAQDGFYYELTVCTDSPLSSGDTILDLMGIILTHVSFRVYNLKGDDGEKDGVLLASCSYN